MYGGNDSNAKIAARGNSSALPKVAGGAAGSVDYVDAGSSD